MRGAALVAFVIAALGHGAAAQGLELQAGLNVGFNQTTQSVAMPDPMPQPGDVQPTSTSSLFTEVRPGITFQIDKRKITLRASALMSALLLYTPQTNAVYTSQANLQALAVPSDRVSATGVASVMLGGEAFLASQRAADTGQPMIRSEGNPTILTTTVGQSLLWEVSPRWSLRETLAGSLVAPKDDFGAVNSSLIGSLAFEHIWPRDAAGFELRASEAELRPLILLNPQPAYASQTASVRARWNHDFSRQANGFVSAGVAQVYTNTGSRPVAVVPVGSAMLRYASGNLVGSLDFNQDIMTNLLVGSVSYTDQIVAHGSVMLDQRLARVLAFSVGALHNEPVGVAGPLAVAATGNAVQADVGLVTLIRKNLLATARYSLSYQFDRADTVGPELFHLITIGVLATFTSGTMRPVPDIGVRVDGLDNTATSTSLRPEAEPVVPESNESDEQ